MEVKVSPNGVQIIIYIVNLLLPPQNIHILHLWVSQVIEWIYQLFSQLESELVLWKVSQALIEEPHVHVSNGVVNVKIILYVHAVHELPGVNVHEETR